jgi:hypothetical protein
MHVVSTHFPFLENNNDNIPAMAADDNENILLKSAAVLRSQLSWFPSVPRAEGDFCATKPLRVVLQTHLVQSCENNGGSFACKTAT